jgi:hypothetical protein
VPTTTPPDDLIALKRQYLDADREYEQILSAFPTGVQIVALIHDGLSPVADEQAQQAHDAYGRCVNLGRLIQAHPWWRAQPSRADAVRALTAAAQQQIGAKQSAPVG